MPPLLIGYVQTSYLAVMTWLLHTSLDSSINSLPLASYVPAPTLTLFQRLGIPEMLVWLSMVLNQLALAVAVFYGMLDPLVQMLLEL